MVTRVCKKCGVEKPETAYHRDGHGYLYRQCKECYNAEQQAKYHEDVETSREYNRTKAFHRSQAARDYRKAYRAKHASEIARKKYEGRIRRVYGMSVEDYEALRDSQGGVCVVCGRDPSPKRLYVDHDHATGLVRGLLCNNCNSAIGLLADNPAAMRAAAAYVERKELPNAA